MAEKLVNNTGLSEFAVKIKESVPQFGESSSGQVSKSLIDLFYPVGSYYETSNTSFNPNTAWGGTWVEDSSGKVTAAYQSGDTNFGTVGQTGGEKTHKLITDEMPSHSHDIFAYASDPVGTPTQAENSRMTVLDRDHGWNMGSQGNIIATGGDQPHNNLQPYIVVKRWHRTA